MTRKYAFHCKACGNQLNNFEHSNLLPDGSEEDLCNSCKEAIEYSYTIRYIDYQHLNASDGMTECLNSDEESED